MTGGSLKFFSINVTIRSFSRRLTRCSSGETSLHSARGAPAEAKRAYRDSVRLPLALMAQADTQGISLRAQSSFGALGKLGDLLYRRSRLGMRTQFFLFSLGVFTADPLLNFFRHEA